MHVGDTIPPEMIIAKARSIVMEVSLICSIGTISKNPVVGREHLTVIPKLLLQRNVDPSLNGCHKILGLETVVLRGSLIS
jgi:hypothetical protein